MIDNMMTNLSDTQARFLRLYLGLKDDGTGSETSTGDLVRTRAFLIARWQRIPFDLQLAVSELAEAVARDLPHEDANGMAARLGQHLSAMTAAMQARINDAVDRAVNAGDSSYAAVRSTIGTLRGELAGNDLMRALDASPLVPDSGFEAAYTDALDEIERALFA